MISLRSLQIFVGLNTLVAGNAYLHYRVLTAFAFHPVVALLSTFLKTFVILGSLEMVTRKKPYLIQDGIPRTQIFVLSEFVTTYSLETVSFLVAASFCSPGHSLAWELVYFVPRSFLFELLFDLFHYSTHRLLHTVPVLYQYIHKTHHEHRLMNSYTTFHHTVADLCLTNVLPIVCASYLVPVPRFTMCMLFWYKTILEVSGHTGKHTSSSFVQCIYLPRLLSISLYSSDHTLHHINPNVNFSKRFSLWDKVFGTYKPLLVSSSSADTGVGFSSTGY
jgi:sterol desaturase/sphingolipid hydroxylase (fatty acid hydroxylase superfamily)